MTGPTFHLSPSMFMDNQSHFEIVTSCLVLGKVVQNKSGHFIFLETNIFVCFVLYMVVYRVVKNHSNFKLQCHFAHNTAVL